MTDIPNRTELEMQLARKISRLSSAHRRELMTLLGDPPNYGNVPIQFWNKVSSELGNAFIPFLTEVYMQSAERMIEDLPVGVDWGLINEHAVQWANQYSFELVRGITTTTQRALQQAISNYFEQGLTMGDLENIIGRSFGPIRAEAIAVTEVTRAASEGEQAIARELEAQGISMIPIWQTNNDELVCPLCAPRHNKPITDGIYPPLHCRCRCFCTHELPKVGR